MAVYIDGVFVLNLLVDWLLLLGASRLCGYPAKVVRTLLAAVLGGAYATVCLLPGFRFWGNAVWRAVSLGLMAVIAYGVSINALRRGLVFAFLTLALGGAVLGIGKSGVPGILGAAGLLCILCFCGFRGRIGGTVFLPVELCYGEKCIHVTALQDTGNTLRDPVTGGQVLVVSAEVAGELTGLTREQLRKPVESMGVLPGLRLIPYRSVGNGGSFLLALRMQEVKIGAWRGSSLVAFAPEQLSAEGAYQALTGGMV